MSEKPPLFPYDPTQDPVDKLAVGLAKAKAIQFLRGAVLGPAKFSRFHRFNAEWLRDVTTYGISPFMLEGIRDAKYVAGVAPHIFVVEHDWSAALGPSLERLSWEVCRPPFPDSVFELQLSGRSLLVIVKELTDRIDLRLGFDVPGVGWFLCHPQALDGLEAQCRRIEDLVLCACVAMDAGVAVAEPSKRKANPSASRRHGHRHFDYHVVRVAARRAGRSFPQLGKGKAGQRPAPRLHFRRGNWHHRAEDRSVRWWVKWCLVGDPDLGFVDKHYRL